ncbi:hypothetical protein CDV55_102328 [Aspergillus turcosus]|nr:hypothetical protein CDV55_102328 [Aspergillus turcosus]
MVEPQGLDIVRTKAGQYFAMRLLMAWFVKAAPVQMQETAEAVGWLQHQSSGVPELQDQSHLIIYQGHNEVYLTLTPGTRYVEYLEQTAPTTTTTDPEEFITMQSFGPWQIKKEPHLRSLCRVLLAFLSAADTHASEQLLLVIPHAKMVTGIEATGLVLALLPLLVNQQDSYVQGLETLKSFKAKRYPRELESSEARNRKDLRKSYGSCRLVLVASRDQEEFQSSRKV